MVEMCVDVVKSEVRMMVELVTIHARGVVVLEVGRPLVRRRWLEFDRSGQGHNKSSLCCASWGLRVSGVS